MATVKSAIRADVHSQLKERILTAIGGAKCWDDTAPTFKIESYIYTPNGLVNAGIVSAQGGITRPEDSVEPISTDANGHNLHRVYTVKDHETGVTAVLGPDDVRSLFPHLRQECVRLEAAKKETLRVPVLKGRLLLGLSSLEQHERQHIYRILTDGLGDPEAKIVESIWEKHLSNGSSPTVVTFALPEVIRSLQDVLALGPLKLSGIIDQSTFNELLKIFAVIERNETLTEEQNKFLITTHTKLQSFLRLVRGKRMPTDLDEVNVLPILSPAFRTRQYLIGWLDQYCKDSKRSLIIGDLETHPRLRNLFDLDVEAANVGIAYGDSLDVDLKGQCNLVILPYMISKKSSSSRMQSVVKAIDALSHEDSSPPIIVIPSPASRNCWTDALVEALKLYGGCKIAESHAIAGVSLSRQAQSKLIDDSSHTQLKAISEKLSEGGRLIILECCGPVQIDKIQEVLSLCESVADIPQPQGDCNLAPRIDTKALVLASKLCRTLSEEPIVRVTSRVIPRYTLDTDPKYRLIFEESLMMLSWAERTFTLKGKAAIFTAEERDRIKTIVQRWDVDQAAALAVGDVQWVIDKARGTNISVGVLKSVGMVDSVELVLEAHADKIQRIPEIIRRSLLPVYPRKGSYKQVHQRIDDKIEEEKNKLVTPLSQLFWSVHGGRNAHTCSDLLSNNMRSKRAIFKIQYCLAAEAVQKPVLPSRIAYALGRPNFGLSLETIKKYGLGEDFFYSLVDMPPPLWISNGNLARHAKVGVGEIPPVASTIYNDQLAIAQSRDQLLWIGRYYDSTTGREATFYHPDLAEKIRLHFSQKSRRKMLDDVSLSGGDLVRIRRLLKDGQMQLEELPLAPENSMSLNQAAQYMNNQLIGINESDNTTTPRLIGWETALNTLNYIATQIPNFSQHYGIWRNQPGSDRRYEIRVTKHGVLEATKIQLQIRDAQRAIRNEDLISLSEVYIRVGRIKGDKLNIFKEKMEQMGIEQFKLLVSLAGEVLYVRRQDAIDVVSSIGSGIKFRKSGSRKNNIVRGNRALKGILAA